MSMSPPLRVSSCSSPPSSDSFSPAAAAVQTPNPSHPPSILHFSSNQNAGCFAVGTTDGFIVYNIDPFGEAFRRDFSGGIGVVQMLFRCNIFALVGASKSDRNKVMIWDDHLNRCISELLFRTEVKAVRLRTEHIVIVLMQNIYVYNFSDFKLIHRIETLENPQGLCEISLKGAMVLVCLGLERGCVRLELYATRKCRHVMAHNSSVAFVALMNDGRLMATASSKGTLVRVFRTCDGSLLQELRRGSERAVICSLSFSPTAQWLAVSSNKGTVHVFSLKVDSRSLRTSRSQETEMKNLAPLSLSRLSFIKETQGSFFYELSTAEVLSALAVYNNDFIPNSNSEWSVAQFRVQEGLQHIVAFGQRENTVIIIDTDGRFYRCEFDPVVGGEMTELESHNFLHHSLTSQFISV